MTHAPDKVRVRYAPSPTGFSQLGNFRTVLYDYLFAKKYGGQFIVRIEDTDQKRFVQGALENTLEILKKFGLTYDEGPVLLSDKNDSRGILSTRYPGIVEIGPYAPYIQSERLDLYKKHALELVEKGAAYYCFCTTERLASLRERQVANHEPSRYDRHCLALSKETVEHNLSNNLPFVIRMLVPEGRGEIRFQDEVRGVVSFDAHQVDDQVLLKSDGYPTYHLAVVVDDHLMDITHVIRGEDWLSSTPKHLLLYEAFGWSIPFFAHLPLILNADKSKLSKRKGDKSVDGYLERGYLKEALINFVALLGWNPGKGNTQEIFSLDDLAQKFDLSQVNKAGAVFDNKKLDWMNHMYLLEKSPKELVELLRAGKFMEQKPFYEEAPVDRKTDEYLEKVLTIEQERLNALYEVGEANQFLFTDALEYPKERLIWKDNSEESTLQALEKALALLMQVPEREWGRESLSALLLKTAGEKRGDFLWPLRVALTGVERSPSPMDVAWVLGKKAVLERIQFAVRQLLSP